MTKNTPGSKRRRRRGAGHRNHRTGRPQRTSNNRMTTRDETSAGGLVVSGLAEAVDEDGNVDLSQIYVALIGRLDRRGRLLWSMPKGHVENGEAKELTAEREVWEETGIHGKVFADLGMIDYWFVSDGVRIHKTVHHHLLRFVDGIMNDEDPEVTEVSWIPVSELIEHLAYADERKLARIAHDLLPDLARKEAAAGKATPR
ncbi:DNA mismatch repair protein MutT [Corynebacterium sp. HMSC062E11]|uniref:NUDIX hydrolase n=1 Tax=unclassified Corynebacterium TaxID=2624378 RepID=UPI0008A28C9B|nr:NUDIX hydrolase [Corynebacterium aurimucosum]OFK26968.1 DNA mismatch repair protein MutT [Corynebacterium sp. HMSC062E11]OFP70202.1 DNA mismatch repair protein MutT [Corynebacterium sp. HMSC078C09]